MLNFEEQKKRVLSGLMYNDLTPELVEARRVAVELTNEYNASYGQPPEVREPLLRKILGEMGEDVFFEPSFRCEMSRGLGDVYKRQIRAESRLEIMFCLVRG